MTVPKHPACDNSRIFHLRYSLQSILQTHLTKDKKASDHTHTPVSNYSNYYVMHTRSAQHAIWTTEMYSLMRIKKGATQIWDCWFIWFVWHVATSLILFFQVLQYSSSLYEEGAVFFNINKVLHCDPVMEWGFPWDLRWGSSCRHHLQIAWSMSRKWSNLSSSTKYEKR